MEKAYDVRYRTGSEWVDLGHVHAISKRKAQELADSLYTRKVEVKEAT